MISAFTILRLFRSRNEKYRYYFIVAHFLILFLYFCRSDLETWKAMRYCLMGRAN